MSFWTENEVGKSITIGVCVLLIMISVAIIGGFWPTAKIQYAAVVEQDLVAAPAEIPRAVHIATPESVKAVYLSSWAAGNRKFREHLFDLVDNTEINSVVIDIKDYTGRISFPVNDPELQAFGAVEERIPDIEDFIARLHDKGVYVIGRISSFQDSFLTNTHPEWAVRDSAGNVWKDYKGVKWLDAGAKPVWDYLVLIGNESYRLGFDELNFDYIRFPSDGNMRDIAYPWSGDRSRTEIMKEFFTFIHDAYATSGIPISADLFGLTTSATGDLGIGQVLEDALVNFDYVAPMVYPSHFGKGYEGFASPAKEPYEIIKRSMSAAAQRAVAASTTPLKLRPWLQAFDLGATYTPDMVRSQIQATYDSGLTSWMLWNAASVYNKEALLPKNSGIVSATSTSAY